MGQLGPTMVFDGRLVYALLLCASFSSVGVPVVVGMQVDESQLAG